MNTSHLVFLICAALAAYLYVGYPAVVALVALLRPRPYVRLSREPRVSVLLVAHDEESVIRQRIENLLDLDYPRHRLELLVGSDGSTDATPARIRRFAAAGVRAFEFPACRGKAATISDLLSAATGEIVVFCDARQRFSRTTLRALVAPFADPRVGAVGGDLVLRGTALEPSVGGGIGLYRRYETAIRAAESRIDSTIGTSGAIYAARRALVGAIPPDTILDDVLIPMRIVRQGYRVVFEPEARAIDRPPASSREELVRKARTIAGNFQIFARERWLLSPAGNRVWLQTVSHKALRLASPLLHAGALVSCVVAIGDPVFAAALAAQVAFYGLAVVGAFRRRGAKRFPIASVAYTLCLLDAATILGFWRFLRGSQPVQWARVTDAAEAGRRSA
jgi:cellulose synthase/poly-beta-1,6-N-acetylglucosamine synthase-like glycosyltransferase